MIIKDIKELKTKCTSVTIKEGKEMKKEGFVYENYELKKKEVNK